jgi:hypothetical protein
MSRAPTWQWAWYMPARNAPDSPGGRGTTLIPARHPPAEPADLCSPLVLTANAECCTYSIRREEPLSSRHRL